MGKILVIDDDPMITQLCKNYFRSKGHFVTLARNGKEGLKLFNKMDFDLIITDLDMPGTHGFEVIDIIKMTRKGEVIPILLLSEDIKDDEISKYERKRFPDDVITKPFDIPVLERKVNALLVEFETKTIVVQN